MVRRLIVKSNQVVPELHYSNYVSVPLGSTWGPREIPDIELILIISGNFAYEDSSGQSELFQAGDMCVILPGVTHTFSNVDTDDNATPLFSCIHMELLAGKSLFAGDYVVHPEPKIKTTLDDPCQKPLKELFRQIADLWELQSEGNADLLQTLLKAVWIYLASHWRQGPEAVAMSPVMRRMTSFLRQRFMDPVGRGDLARRFDITPQYVNRLFKDELGLTPTEYLNRYRVRQAAALLARTTMSVADIALATGFNDQFYFSRIFKRYTGSSPMHYSCEFVKNRDSL